MKSTRYDGKTVLLVLAIDAIGPSRLPKLFRDAGYRVVLFGPRPLAAKFSRYVHHHLIVPDDEKDFVECLQHHLAIHGDAYAWIQMGDEIALRRVAAHHEESWTLRCLPVPSRKANLDLVLDKLEFLRKAHKAGLPIPDLRFAESLAEVAEAIDRLGYPLYVKQSESLSGSGVLFLSNPQDFMACEWSTLVKPFIAIQKSIQGQVGSTEVLFDHGKPVAWISSYHRDHWPHRFAASCTRELCEIPVMHSLLDQLGRLTQFHGLAGIDWIIEEKSDRLFLIELNPRPTPCYHLGPLLGVDFSSAFRDMLEGHDKVRAPIMARDAKTLVHQFPQYCYRVFEQRDYGKLLRVWGDTPLNDPLLTLALIRRFMTHQMPMHWRIRAKKMFLWASASLQ